MSAKPFTRYVTGRVVAVRRHGHTMYGNPMMSVRIDPDVSPGAYGIESVPWDHEDPNTMRCYDCRRAWLEDITPAGRCPWEHTHGSGTWYRISDNAGLVYGIKNSEYRDAPHVFDLTRAGRLSGYTRTVAEHVARSMDSMERTLRGKL